MPQLRKLYGVVNSLGKNSILIGGHNDSVEKLNGLNYTGKGPLTNTGKFFVVFKEESNIPENIVGKKISICVRPKKYKFYSTYEKNKGELIEGWKLYMISIKLDSDWT